MGLTSKLDKLGRLVIPQEIRERLGLEPGTTFKVEETSEGIHLKPDVGDPCVTDREGVLVYSGSRQEDIENAVQKHRQKRLQSFGGAS
ncbi:MAG: AbrB/MazE/SpoVT family DNA-binding domain-containing protein [bacterium]